MKITNKFFEYFDIEGDEGIKDVFKKIKEKPEQTKVREFDGSNQEDDGVQKIGEFDVIDIENNESEEKMEEDSETIGKLEVYDEKDSYEDAAEDIFDGSEKFTKDQKEIEETPKISQESESKDSNEKEEGSSRTKEIVEDLLDEEEPINN